MCVCMCVWRHGRYYIPLRLAACAAPRTRFVVSLRDPTARAFSAWLYKRWGGAPTQLPELLNVSRRFARDVSLELRGLQGVDLTSAASLSAPDLWMELYIRLLWQERLRGLDEGSCGAVKCALRAPWRARALRVDAWCGA